MVNIIVASKNPVKLNAVTAGFKKMFPEQKLRVVGISGNSGVPDQPVGYAQTLQGAKNRVKALTREAQKYDFYVGLEGGIDNTETGTEAFAWAYIENQEGKAGKGKTGSFYLPMAITNLLNAGLELGDASDKVFHEKNSKQNNGSIGLLTDNAIDRTAFYVEAIIYALIPFKNESLYF